MGMAPNEDRLKGVLIYSAQELLREKPIKVGKIRCKTAGKQIGCE